MTESTNPGLLVVNYHSRRERLDHAARMLGLAVQPDIVTEIAVSPSFWGKGLF